MVSTPTGLDAGTSVTTTLPYQTEADAIMQGVWDCMQRCSHDPLPLMQMAGFISLIQQKNSKGHGKKVFLENKTGLTELLLLTADKHPARCDQELLHAHHGVSTAEEIYLCGKAGLSTQADVCFVLCVS